MSSVYDYFLTILPATTVEWASLVILAALVAIFLCLVLFGREAQNLDEELSKMAPEEEADYVSRDSW